MKKLTFILSVLFLLVACNKEEGYTTNETVDQSILGTWQVGYSKTINGVRMLDDGSLQIINKADTTEFFGKPNKPISSYMFGQNENIIEIRNDNKIKIFFINSKGGVNITGEYVWYYVDGDTLKRKNPKFETSHKYYMRNDSLIIERIPSEDIAWKYTISRYSRKD
ncbi:hypothetical protein D0T49_06170 [Paludibacter sp. 221]|uniref:hypothetical protein n=1 Tax=Paludibacter sp. 221 TaxID=2302939 RepID=UPI0013D5A09F|nr:hypothetical protein [Paludibacter sp. 221]NDV46628.1 hypothetical protein [Paludibacter sp. 221]